MKNKKIVIGFFAALLLLLFVETYIYVNFNSFDEKDTKITFVVPGDNLDEWENMRIGAQTAALDANCTIDFINSPTDMGEAGEQALITRQKQEGADYVVTTKDLVIDSYSMAIDFGKYIVNQSDCKKVAILSCNEDLSAEFLEGLKDIFDQSNFDYDYVFIPATSEDLYYRIYDIQQSGAYDGIITLDYSVMEQAVRINEKFGKTLKIFSADNSQEAVYYLDSGAISALAFKDDYSIGFLVVKEILENSIFNGVAKRAPMYYIADRDTMYSEELEKVLYPFVK